MPITRPFTAEEHITMAISNTMSGLMATYSGRVDARALMGSIMANTCIGINTLIEGSSMSIAERATMRGDLKTLVNRALRPPLGIVDPSGEKIHGMEIPDVEDPTAKEPA